MKKVSRVFDVQKNNQVKNNFTGVPDGSDEEECTIHYSLAEIQVRGTDRLLRTNEHKNFYSDRKES